MLLSLLILALSVSIDSFGIGITYGIRNTKICRTSKIILFMISILITTLSVHIGGILNEIFSENFTKWIGACFLVLMGLWIIYQAISPKKEEEILKRRRRKRRRRRRKEKKRREEKRREEEEKKR